MAKVGPVSRGRTTGESTCGCPKRPPGRPPLDARDPSARVSVTMPSKQLDDYAKRAFREHVSIPEIIRRDLEETLRRRAE